MIKKIVNLFTPSFVITLFGSYVGKGHRDGKMILKAVVQNNSCLEKRLFQVIIWIMCRYTSGILLWVFCSISSWTTGWTLKFHPNIMFVATNSWFFFLYVIFRNMNFERVVFPLNSCEYLWEDIILTKNFYILSINRM